MNYRHAFHAGNFADVLKHAVLARILVHLGRKDAPFRVLDTHAGTGLYDLGAPEAEKTDEWRSGIGRMVAEPFEPAVARLLEPYLSAVAHTAGRTLVRHLGNGRLWRYPGSPLVIRNGLRRIDRATVVELHPADAATLAANFAGDARMKVVELDGWLALKSFLPFKERRGMVVIDPPFEKEGEFERIVEGLQEATKRFAGGCYLVWHPIKSLRELEQFHAAVVATGLRRVMSVELAVSQILPDAPLSACGLLIVNPPWKLDEELDQLLPAIATRLANGPGAEARWRWIVPE